MVTIKVIGKLAFVKAIKEVCNVSLKEAKEIADKIIPVRSWTNNDPVTFNLEQFGWTIETLKEILRHANMYDTNVILYNV